MPQIFPQWSNKVPAALVAVAVVLGGLASLLSVVLVGLPLLFYVQVASVFLLGRGYVAGLGAAEGTSTTATSTSA